MREVTCSQCGRSVPMNDSMVYDDRVFCMTCAEVRGKEPEVTWKDARRGVDPTVCAWCRRDNGSTPLPTDGVAPVCPDCHERQLRHPFPRWVRIFLFLVIALAAGGMVLNARFYRAWTP